MMVLIIFTVLFVETLLIFLLFKLGMKNKRKSETASFNSIEQGIAELKYNQGIRFYERKEYKSSIECFREAIVYGHPKATYMYGLHYFDGLGVVKDSDYGFKQLMKAAETEVPEAQNKVGHCYENGLSVPKNIDEAIKWYRKAAEQGDARGQCNLGNCYSEGKGVDQDYEEAVKWYRKAAEQGLADAQYNLGLCHACGRGINQDYEEAVKLYRKAADQGLAVAQSALGSCYMYGRDVVINRDYAEAVKWLTKAAEQGNTAAQDDLAECYREGLGVERDYVKATWLIANVAGKRGEFFELGQISFCGHGVTRNCKEAAKWYRKSYERRENAPDALPYFVSCYLESKGVKKDNEDEAYKWFFETESRVNKALSVYKSVMNEENTPEKYKLIIEDLMDKLFFTTLDLEFDKWREENSKCMANSDDKSDHT